MGTGGAVGTSERSVRDRANFLQLFRQPLCEAMNIAAARGDRATRAGTAKNEAGIPGLKRFEGTKLLLEQDMKLPCSLAQLTGRALCDRRVLALAED